MDNEKNDYLYLLKVSSKDGEIPTRFRVEPLHPNFPVSYFGIEGPLGETGDFVIYTESNSSCKEILDTAYSLEVASKVAKSYAVKSMSNSGCDFYNDFSENKKGNLVEIVRD